jgi:hypothetical protein
MAAIPDANALACSPPSNVANDASSAVRVGTASREYRNPAFVSVGDAYSYVEFA